MHIVHIAGDGCFLNIRTTIFKKILPGKKVYTLSLNLENILFLKIPGKRKVIFRFSWKKWIFKFVATLQKHTSVVFMTSFYYLKTYKEGRCARRSPHLSVRTLLMILILLPLLEKPNALQLSFSSLYLLFFTSFPGLQNNNEYPWNKISNRNEVNTEHEAFQ